MADFAVFGDFASFGVGMGIDSWARRTGQYKGGWRAEGGRFTASAFAGAIGTVLGGPLLGIALSAFGQAVGHLVDNEDIEVAEREHRRNQEYARMGRDFVSAHCDCFSDPEVDIVDWGDLGNDVYAIVYDCDTCNERKVLVFRGPYARRYYGR